MRIKRIITALLVTLLMFSLVAFAAAAEGDETLALVAEVKPVGASSDDLFAFKNGDIVEYTIMVNSNPGVAEMQIFLGYDSTKLEFIKQDKYESAVFNEANGDRFGVTKTGNEFTNKVGVMITGFALEGLNTSTGTLVTLQFKILTEDCGKVAGPKFDNILAYNNDKNYPEVDHSFVNCKTMDVHSYGEAIIGESTSCVVGESVSYVCTKCNFKVEKVKDPIGSHTFSKWFVDTEATCETDGVQTRFCTVCGYNETDSIPSPGHTAGAVVEENRVEATCTVPGSYEAVVKCTVCNEEISRETVAIPAPGHTPAEAVKENDVAPTCTADGGYDMVVYCTVCKAEISRVTTVLPKTGHTPATEVVIENVKEATCTAKGSHDEVIYCTVETCKAEISREVVEDAALGHKEVVDAKVEPTCTENGKTEGAHCSVCEEVLEPQVEIPALNHKWSDWKVTVEPTTSATGEKSRTCSTCSTEETATVAKLPVISASAIEWKKGNPVLVFTSDAAYADFINVTVNGEVLAEGVDYTVAEGSTVVTLTEEYLKSLEKGGYEISINSNNGSAKITFVVKGGNALWIALIIIGAVLVSGVVAAYVIIYLRKKRNNA